uniref:N-acetyllactosaminide beta-1,3-N-acetylglucosaminyltransferase n=1 Tax=Rhabditophanes sp. KR3021 TaxID=114890 RepID=A0AC35TMS3_9BILA
MSVNLFILTFFGLCYITFASDDRLTLPVDKEVNLIRHNKDYVYFPNVFKSNYTNFNNTRISLILHCSNDYINSGFSKHVQNWKGPISLGIYIRTTRIASNPTICTYCTLKKVANLTQNTFVHFIYAVNANSSIKPTGPFFTTFLSSINCENEEIVKKSCTKQVFTITEKARRTTEYPINVVRNIARILSKTDYIIIADFDHMFSENFEQKLLPLAKIHLTNDSRKALTYRIFEVDESVEIMPKNKSTLFSLMAKKKANIFHSYYPEGHTISRLQEWINTKDSATPEIQFEEKYIRSTWEPQFCSNRNIPPFDETFYYPLRDNTELRWELCRQNYTFLIVNDVFMYHIGTKKPTDLSIVQMARSLVSKRIKKISYNFKKRMNTLYPETKDKCPIIDI